MTTEPRNKATVLTEISSFIRHEPERLDADEVATHAIYYKIAHEYRNGTWQ